MVLICNIAAFCDSRGFRPKAAQSRCLRLASLGRQHALRFSFAVVAFLVLNAAALRRCRQRATPVGPKLSSWKPKRTAFRSVKAAAGCCCDCCRTVAVFGRKTDGCAIGCKELQQHCCHGAMTPQPDRWRNNSFWNNTSANTGRPERSLASCDS